MFKSIFKKLGGKDGEADEVHGILWEREEIVTQCRSCNSVFGPKSKKIHCKCCEGIYCSSCILDKATVFDKVVSKACRGCFRGETPGDEIRTTVEQALTDNQTELQMPAKTIEVQRGGKYGENGEMLSPNEPRPPPQGYFEIINKTDGVCCLKLLEGGGDPRAETVRPSYIAGISNSLYILF